MNGNNLAPASWWALVLYIIILPVAIIIKPGMLFSTDVLKILFLLSLVVTILYCAIRYVILVL